MTKDLPPWEMRNVESYWSFALVNGHLAELHWYKDKKGKITEWAHGYVLYSQFSKKERKRIDKDLETNAFSWRRKGGYKHLSPNPEQIQKIRKL